jgi:hypothetical protein
LKAALNSAWVIASSFLSHELSSASNTIGPGIIITPLADDEMRGRVAPGTAA